MTTRQVPTTSTKGRFQPIVLTDEQDAWLRKHFKHTKNADIAQRLVVSARTVGRLAKERGLTKSKQFIRKCNDEATTKMHQANLDNGRYPPKGYVIPNREVGQFKKGERIVDRIGKKREAERIVKCAESRRKTFKLEKARALYGLPRQTKLKVVQRPRRQIVMRHQLKKLGYIIERGGTVAYYNEQTNRSLTLEQKPRTGFTFLKQDGD